MTPSGLPARALILLTGLAAAAGGLGPIAEPGATARISERPNVLIIVTDDQRARDTMGVMPRTRAWFGGGGTTYTNAVATTPVCCPSRASILTGRYAHNHGIQTNRSPTQLDHASTIQRYLHDAGYRTAIAGKFLNNYGIGKTPPYFDRFAVMGGSYYGADFNIDGTLTRIRNYSTDFVSDWATGVLSDFESADDAPWFLYVAPFAPHEPFTPSPEYEDAPVGEWPGNPAVFESDRSDKPPWVRSAKANVSDGRAHRLGQLRTLRSVDDLVRRLSESIESLREQNTLAFFLSDNGYLWGEHGLLDKSKPYLPSIEVPFYMRWPGRVMADRVSDRLAETVDIVPTILDAARVSSAPSVPIDGESLLDLSERKRQLTENWEWRQWASLRGPGYQYIEWYDDTGAVTFREYYDLVADPWQLENLLADADPLNDPDIGALSSQLAHDRECVGTSGTFACPAGEAEPPPPPPQPTLSIGDAVPVAEGPPGAKLFARFRVSLSSASSEPVTSTYSTADGTAAAGPDYVATSGNLTLPAGTTSRTVKVTVRGDVVDEIDETFVVNLSNPNGATIADAQGQGTIVDDDP